jgi:hypothetical protein
MLITDKLKNSFRAIFSPTRTDTPTIDVLDPNQDYMYGNPVYDSARMDILNILKLEQDLVTRYLDYESMDDMDLLSSAIDVYTEDTCQPSYDTQLAVWIKTSDKDVAQITKHLFDRIEIEDKIHDWVRTLCKYGNDFERLIIDPEINKIIGTDFVSPPQMRRYERMGNLGYAFSPTGNFDMSDENVIQSIVQGKIAHNQSLLFDFWEVLHFRLRTKNRGSRYGFSIMESSRGAWKRLTALENVSVIYKMQRNPGRFAFYINTGNLAPNARMAYMNKIKQNIKKRKFYNPTSGQIEFRNHYLSYDEDIWLPISEGRDTTRVESVSGPDFDAMALLDYHIKKIIAGVKIPRAYLTYEEEANGKSLLSHEDARFARVVMKVQRVMRNGLNQMVDVELALCGLDPTTIDHEVLMATPSHIYELAQLELESTRTSLAASYGDFVSRYWIMANIFGFSDDEISVIMKQREIEAFNAIREQTVGIPGFGQLDAKTLEGFFSASDLASGGGEEDIAISPEMALNPEAELDRNIGFIADTVDKRRPEGEDFVKKSRSMGSVPVGISSYNVPKQSNIIQIPAVKKEDLDKYLFAGSKKIEKKMELEMEKMMKQNRKLFNEIKESVKFVREVSDNLGYKNKKGLF